MPVSFGDLCRRFGSMFRREQDEQELHQELQFHLEQQIEQLVREGHSPEKARRMAKLEFGGVEQIKEECREARLIAWIESTRQDVRYGGRVVQETS